MSIKKLMFVSKIRIRENFFALLKKIFLPIQKRYCSWYEQDEIIYFTVTSDGTPGTGWIRWLMDNNLRITDYAMQMLLSPDFKPTKGIVTKVGVMRGELFSEYERYTESIRAEADKRKLTKPNPEIACLIMKQLTEKQIKDMDLTWIAVMHEPIIDSKGDLRLLIVELIDVGLRLRSSGGKPEGVWSCQTGFAFVVSEKKEPEANNMNA